MCRRTTISFGLLMLASLGCQESSEPPTEPTFSAGQPMAIAATSLIFRQISAGGTHTCGVTTDDQAFCWPERHRRTWGRNYGASAHPDPGSRRAAVPPDQRRVGSHLRGDDRRCGILLGAEFGRPTRQWHQ